MELQEVSDIEGQIEIIEATYKQYFPDEAVNSFFLDRFFDQQYQAAIRFNRLFTFFSSLAIFVACLGFFGLSSYTTLQRTKELGIRKVLGASVNSLLVLLSQEYLWLMLVATCLAIPATLFLGNNWLNNFAFRIEVGPALLIIPALALVLISFLTVSYRTYAAARANPVDSLKVE